MVRRFADGLLQVASRDSPDEGENSSGMAVLADDTSLEAERFLVRRWSESSPTQVREQMNASWRFAQKLQNREAGGMEPDQVTQTVLEALVALQVPYLIGGSVASSLYGETRFTQDTDVIAEIDTQQACTLLASLEQDFYGSETAAREAVQRKSCFNLIHLTSNYKVDIFVSKRRPFDIARFHRRVHPAGFPDIFWFSTAEDVLLRDSEYERLASSLASLLSPVPAGQAP